MSRSTSLVRSSCSSPCVPPELSLNSILWEKNDIAEPQGVKILEGKWEEHIDLSEPLRAGGDSLRATNASVPSLYLSEQSEESGGTGWTASSGQIKSQKSAKGM